MYEYTSNDGTGLIRCFDTATSGQPTGPNDNYDDDEISHRRNNWTRSQENNKSDDDNDLSSASRTTQNKARNLGTPTIPRDTPNS
ncbi:hypothetical protein C0995_006505 [Termitomyces sp. Mi166|nr:hypothetical protein C0995_006505 [Termitomyces sp. Mi166\